MSSSQTAPSFKDLEDKIKPCHDAIFDIVTQHKRIFCGSWGVYVLIQQNWFFITSHGSDSDKGKDAVRTIKDTVARRAAAANITNPPHLTTNDILAVVKALESRHEHIRDYADAQRIPANESNKMRSDMTTAQDAKLRIRIENATGNIH
jgi:hypothetical protein